MNKRFLGKGDFLSELSIFLNEAHADNKEVILVVDEAQQITPELLEDIRLISNIEKPEKKLINIIFSGQTNFNEILNNNFALRTRMAIFYKIEPLSEPETDAYITHRLHVAGSDRRIFSSNAIHEIYSLSEGNPRQINIICDLSLLHAYSAETIKVDAGIIKECSKRALIPIPKPEPLAEYLPTDAIVPSDRNRDPSSGILHRLWHLRLNRIRSTLSLYKIAYLAPVLLIILISLIGIVFYPDSFYSSISNVKLQVRQAVNRYYADPPKEDASFQAQVVNLMTPAQSNPVREEPATNLENGKNRNEKLTKKQIARLSHKLNMMDQQLAHSKQRQQDLETELAQSNISKDQLNGELQVQTTQVAELQKELAAATEAQTVLEDELKKKQDESEQLQKQIKKANSQKTSTETRLANLQTAHDALVVELEELQSLRAEVVEYNQALSLKDEMLALRKQELKRAKTELTELKHALAKKERLLTQRAQRQQDMENILVRAQKSNVELNAELSSRAASVADLQQKLELARVEKAVGEKQLQKNRQETVLLQAQFRELAAQKASSESQFDYLRTAHTALTADIEELKKTKEQVAELEHALSIKDQIIDQREYQRKELERNLVQAQNTNDILKGDLSQKAALVADLQKNLSDTKAAQVDLQGQLNANRREMKLLQRQLNDLEIKESNRASKPPDDQTQISPRSKVELRQVEAEAPNPTDIIDWVIKKKLE